MASVFLYGTLRHAPLLAAVLGREDARLSAATLTGHAVAWAEGQAFPLIHAREGARADGLLLDGLSPEDLARLEFYEGGFDYALRGIEVEAGGRTLRTQAWFPAPGAPWVPGAAFALEDWVARWGEINTAAAAAAMTLFGRVPAAELGWRLPAMQARAASTLRAAGMPAPATLRRAGGRDEIRTLDMRRPYDAFFAVAEADLRFPRFDGGQSDAVTRAAFVMADAVSVLPYDPARDRVLLIEQLRIGPWIRGDRHVFSLEAIAGRIDPGETPEEAGRREAVEEAGLALGPMELVARYYPSPAGVTEYLFSYVACCDLPDGADGPGGAADEHEDIRSHLVSFDDFLGLIRSGEVENAPLILSGYWLLANRERLRAAG